MERWGILGGTFDPIHVGHLVAAEYARSQLQLARVLLVVAGDPWQKHGNVVASAEDRYDMVAAALDGVEGLEVSRLELDRNGATYTIDTVNALAADDRELVLIVGADVADRLGTWDRVDQLRATVTLAIVDREGNTPSVPPAGWKSVLVSMPRLDVSSTALRQRVHDGQPVDFLVPAGALQILHRRGLYTAR